MKPAALLLSTFVATLRSSFCSLLGIFAVSFVLSNSAYGQELKMPMIRLSTKHDGSHVIRCVPRTIPGEKFSREDLIRSQRELANLQFFNQELVKKEDSIKKANEVVNCYEFCDSTQLELISEFRSDTRLVSTYNIKTSCYIVPCNRTKSQECPSAQNDSIRICGQTEFTTDQLELSAGWGNGIGYTGTLNVFSNCSFIKVRDLTCPSSYNYIWEKRAKETAPYANDSIVIFPSSERDHPKKNIDTTPCKTIPGSLITKSHSEKEDPGNDQLELSAGWGGGHGPGILGVTFNNFSIQKLFGKNLKWDPLDTSTGQFLSNKYFPTIDSLILTPQQKKRRTWIMTGTQIAGYGGVMTALAAAWYDKYTKTNLHSFDDSREWLQVDKVGHFYGTWIESRANNELWKWTGMERKKRIWISGLTSIAFQTTIEYLDGKSAEWGWSWSDFAANLLGSGTFIAQELAWNEQKIKLKWAFHRKIYKNDPSLDDRSDVLFGKSNPERFLKDYNGQSYWASIGLKTLFPKSNLPAWLSVSVGYGAEGMFGAESNIAKDDNGNIIFNRTDIRRHRQWFLAPDIDLSKIKTNKKALKFLFTVLSAFKFPAPAFEFSKRGFRVHALLF